jgi:hypothetical protein
MKSNSKKTQDASIEQQCLCEPVRFRETEWRIACFGVVAGLWFQMMAFAYRYYAILRRHEIDVSIYPYYGDVILYSIVSILFLTSNCCQRSYKVTHICRLGSVYVGGFLAGSFVECTWIDFFLGEPFQLNNFFWVLSIFTSLAACYFLAARSCCWCEGDKECGSSSFSIENDDQVLENEDCDEDIEYRLLIV